MKVQVRSDRTNGRSSCQIACLVSLRRLNPSVPGSMLEEALYILSKPQHLWLIKNNRAYEIDGQMRGDSVRLIDFEPREIEEESRTLAELRDMLLPKLISGHLQINDAEQIIGNIPDE